MLKILKWIAFVVLQTLGIIGYDILFWGVIYWSTIPSLMLLMGKWGMSPLLLISLIITIGLIFRKSVFRDLIKLCIGKTIEFIVGGQLYLFKLINNRDAGKGISVFLNIIIGIFVILTLGYKGKIPIGILVGWILGCLIIHGIRIYIVLYIDHIPSIDPKRIFRKRGYNEPIE